jgi:ribonuclease P protein component
MTPPVAQGDRHSAEAPAAPPAVSVCPAPASGPVRLEALQNRPDFLKAASARRQGTESCLLQARDRRDDTALVRVGFTASKKIGNAVARNRAKRRLRAAARAVLATGARPGWDYVLVARPQATIARPYADLLRDIAAALQAVHAPAKGPRK